MSIKQDVIKRKGLLITLDGLDGCGKSTQAERLSIYCAANNIPFIHIAQPGASELGYAIRGMIKTKPMKDESRLLLLLTAWVDTFISVINPALEEGKVVISERGWSSFVAYQGFGYRPELFDPENEDRDIYKLTHSLIDNYIKPDIAEQFIYLKLDKAERSARKDIVSDEIEKQYDGLYRKLEEGFTSYSSKYNILSTFPYSAKTIVHNTINCSGLSVSGVTDIILHVLNKIDKRFDPLHFYNR